MHIRTNASRRHSAVSVVIPVYNEQAQLRACLEAIACQTVRPLEVIVVDNNCTDRSVAIAQSFDFVRVVREKHQGKVFARNAGFNAARGGIIARIDADTHLRADWIERMLSWMERHPQAAAVTGKCYYREVSAPRVVGAVHTSVYYGLQKWIAGTQLLWGSNMAIRTEAWRQVAASCSLLPDAEAHEDIDLSLQLKRHRLKILRSRHLIATASLMRGNVTPGYVITYLRPWTKTYTANHMYIRAALIYMLKLLVLAGCLPLSVLYNAGLALKPRHIGSTASDMSRYR